MSNIFCQEHPREIVPIFEACKKFFDNEIRKGKNLKNTKSFSGKSLESCSRYAILTIIDCLKEKYPNIDMGLEDKDHYIKSDYVGLSRERLDQHVYLNDKYVFIQEDRAWIDKPFYTQKRSVVRNMMISCESKLSKNIKFSFLAYCIDIKPEIMNTCNLTQGYGDRIQHFSLTGRPRSKKVNGKNVNWYGTGFVDETIKDYLTYVYNTLEGAINETSDSVPRRLSV